MADLLSAALDYAAAGVHVFPARVDVVDGRKHIRPVMKWREASSTSAAQLREWFAPGQPYADASLCIDCGRSRLVVVDLDVTGGHDGITAWGALMAEHDIEPTPVRSHTPSGGEHWFYAEHDHHVVGIDSSGKVAPGVDIRGLGGFVIAWPSEDARGAYGTIDPAELAAVPVVPDLVIERMTKREASAATEERAAGLGQVTSIWDTLPRQFTRDEAIEFCRPAFTDLRSAQVGEINHRLNAAAITIGHFVPAVWSRAQATRILRDALGDTDYDGVTWKAEATIASGLGANTWKAEIVAERGVEPADPDDDEAQSQYEAQVDTEARRELFKRAVRRRADDIEHGRTWTAPADVGTLAQWLAQPEDGLDWRIENLLAVGHNALVVSGRKSGKTTLVDSLVRSYVDGWPFLGRLPMSGTDRNVAVFNYEVDERQYRRWLRATGIAATDRVHVLNLRGRTLPLTNGRIGAWVAVWLAARDIGMWIVDPYSRAYVGSVDNGNDEAQVGRFLDALDVIKTTGGVDELVMPVHTPKLRVAEGDETAIGSQRLEAWADAIWYLTRGEGELANQRYLRAEGRDVSMDESPLNYDEGDRSLMLDRAGGSRANHRRALDAEAVATFVREHPGCTANEIGNGLGWADKRKIKAAREAAARSRFVRWESGPNRSEMHYPIMEDDE
jgi:hypothetical protein